MAITYDAVNNRILADGFSEVTPMDYDDFVTADRAGSYEILAAVAPALDLTLDNAIRPVESLALLITFTLTGTNAGAGDTLDVTGTDAWGDALSENIDVSGGNAAYTTTERFATITDIDCTGFADGVGTVSATQPQWGVVWENRGSQGKFDCRVLFGNATDGYCAFEQMQICYDTGSHTADSLNCFEVSDGSQLRFGAVADATSKATKYHSQLLFYRPAYRHIYGLSGGYSSEIHLLGCNISYKGNGIIQLSTFGADNKIWNTLISGSYFRSPQGDFFNVTATNGQLARSPGTGAAFNQIFVLYADYAMTLQNTARIENLYGRGLTNLFNLEYFRNTVEVVNADVNTWDISGSELQAGRVKRIYTDDLHIVDEDGNDWTSKTVEMKDNDDDEVFSVSTDGSGEIAQQEVMYKSYGFGGEADNNEYPHVINLKDGATLVHTLTGLILDGPMKRRIEIPASGAADIEIEVNSGRLMKRLSDQLMMGM